MPKTPLRAVRVPDELWQAAQARAREAGETVSEVVRRALSGYVGPPAAGQVAQAGSAADDVVGPPAVAADNGFLLAQGILMQRLGVDADAAAVYLRHLSQSSRLSVEETAQRVVERRAGPHLERAPG